MSWRKKIEDAIYHLYHRYDLQGLFNQQARLLALCMNDLELWPDLKKELKTDQQIEYFVIQTALEYLE